MSTEKDQKDAFMFKCLEFRTLIKKESKEQKEAKGSFRQEVVRNRTLPGDQLKIESAYFNTKRTRIVYTKSHLRHLLLAYAMYRGKAYISVEAECNEAPQGYKMWRVFKTLGIEDKFKREDIVGWLEDREPPTLRIPKTVPEPVQEVMNG